MKLLRKNSQKGFTLIELILVFGIITLMTIGIYIRYRTINLERSVQAQVQDLYAFNKKINAAYQSSNTLVSLNNTNAISGGLVPTELINLSNIINRFGTTITLSRQSVAGVEGYEILLNNVPKNACSLIATSKYANEVDEIWMNGANKKTTGSSLSSMDIVNIVSQCNTAISIGFRNRMFFNIPPDMYVQKRAGQTNKYYIPTLNNTVISASTSCGSGGSWNGSFCSCPSGTEFDGTSCTSNTTPLNCAYGTGTDLVTRTCTALPSTKTQETIYNGTSMITQSVTHYNAPIANSMASCAAANGYWDAITNICGGILPANTSGSITSLSPTYQGGRHLPQVMNTEVNLLLQDTKVRDDSSRCSANGGNWDGKICNYCVDPTKIDSYDTGIIDPKNGVGLVTGLSAKPVINPNLKSAHAIKSNWDVDRCVTPPASAAPPYPQVVDW